MLSILIPIYNFQVVKLVDELIDQCKKANINFEILCLDDGSTTAVRQVNQEINGRFNVNYVELTTNIGRSKIRNRLANLARYDWLLFLDCDSKVKSKKFIKKYVEALGSTDICIGGTSYRKRPPKNVKKQLHWHYGTNRESVSAKRRSKHPWRFFHSNNFVIARSLILKTPFNETLNSYGYEDLAFGQIFKYQGSSLVHLDNQIHHIGLKEFDLFMRHQKEAMCNLASLYAQKLLTDTRLIKWHEGIVKTGLKKPLFKWVKSRESRLLDGLKSNPNRLFRLDLLKLFYFEEALNNTFTKA